MNSTDIWKFRNSRTDGKIAVMLDSNVWNWLHARQDTFQLCAELPSEQFALYIPREVEIEHQAIPAAKVELRQFIDSTIDERGITTTSYFGFATQRKVQTFGGFNAGTFADLGANERLRVFYELIGNPRPTGLSRDEADAMLANHAFSCVVLSCDCKQGPLLEATKRGGKVLYLQDDHALAGTMRAAISDLWLSNK